MTTAPTADRVVDCRDTYCPVPIVRLRQEIDQIDPGQVIKIIATDPGSVKDFQAFSKQTGNELLSHSEANKEFTFFMKRK